MHNQRKSDRPATERVHAQLHIRISGAALDAIKAAAAARGEDVTGFVLRACREQAARDRLTDRLARERRAARALRFEWAAQDRRVEAMTSARTAEARAMEG
jgi:uncharacterized protein (DUF1778 family)